jgi:transcriptional regulator with XRE-family HTH domain
MDLSWHVGDVVRKLRLKNGWTQKELARRAKLHHNTIVRLEDGDEGVQARTLKQVAEALGVPRKELWAHVPIDTHSDSESRNALGK